MMTDQNENSSASGNGDEPERKKLKTSEEREGLLLGYGNPLLDIQAVGNADFLNKYGLEANNAILAEDQHKPMYQDMVDTFKDVQYVPGGATLNAIKVAQWLTGVKNATTFFGNVSRDKYGDILKEKAEEMGVNIKFQYTDPAKEVTGTCAVIVTGDNRSLCANLAAANLFTESHLDDSSNWSLVEKSDFFYCAGFPLTVSPPTIQRLAKHAYENKKTFCLNLSAPFLCQFFKEPMLATLPYVDILFGNESEALTFAKENKFDTEDIQEIAVKLAAWPKENSDKPRLVVITQGELPVVTVKNGEKAETFPVIPIKKADIVDTNGAGDAFVGGFLAQLIQGQSVAECVRCGHYAANLVIQRSGCTVPDKPDFK